MTLYDCDVFRIHGSILSVIFLSFVIISRSKQIFHSKHDYSPTNLIVSPQHVAFVFAGSARSFVSPYVHKTIKHNLIDSFCPHDNMCKYDVFVRVSSNDNNHVGANSHTQNLSHFIHGSKQITNGKVVKENLKRYQEYIQ